MNNNVSKELHSCIKYAMDLCQKLNQSTCTREHILLGLFQQPQIVRLLKASGVKNFSELKRVVLDYVEKEVPQEDNIENLDFTPGTTHLFNVAYNFVRGSGREEINAYDVLLAYFFLHDADRCTAYYFLQEAGADVDAIRHNIIHSNFGQPTGQPAEGPEEMNTQVKEYLVNLNELAKNNKIDPIVGREWEIERVVQVLCRRRKNNPILVGEPGVGKTAIAEGLALKIHLGTVPDPIKNATVLSLDIGQLMAGTKYRGEFEERMKLILKTLKDTPNSILFIDEIHTIIGTGATSGSSLDMGNLLKPILTRGEIKCIGSTTFKEFNNIFEKDAALARRFQKVDVLEPSVDDTTKILMGLKPALEQHHSVKYTDDAVKSASELAAKYINDRFLPDKAIDVLDEAGSAARLKGIKNIDTLAIEKIVAKIARIPEKSVSTEKKGKLQNLAQDLKLKLFGQDEAIESVVQSIELASAGLRTEQKPIGNFLFCGPTGVGKTELCKQLAQVLSIPFFRFDMSEYSEKHTISRLIGAPPGYVGYEQAGQLTDTVRKNPHAVILLDEIEKAHSDIWNMLLQIMDHASLTDNMGRKADFRNCIIIMTSNVGSHDLSRRGLGLSASDQPMLMTTKPTKAVEQTFSPEFRNRLDAIVYFNPLNKQNIIHVLDKNLLELQGQLVAKNVTLTLEDNAKNWLAEKGYDPLMGARPMARLIQDKLKRPLSSQLLYGKLENGGSVRAYLEGNEIKFDFSPLTKESEVTPKKPRNKPKLIEPVA